MATKDYDAMIRKAIQSGNYAVDTPKSVLQQMFPDLAQWRLDRLGMENLSENTQNYINSPFSTIDNMDTSLMNYGTQDTFSYNRMNPASLQMQSVDELPYDPSTLNTVYQSSPPLQGPQPFVGPSEFNTTNYEPDLSTLQIADGLPYDSSTLNTVYESLPPIQGPQTPSEYYSNLKGWGRNPFVSEEFVSTDQGNVPKNWMEPATDLAKNLNKEEEMMLAGAESLGWKELGSLSPISTNPIGPRTDNLDMDGDGALDYFKGDFNRYSDPIVNNIPSTANITTGNVQNEIPVSAGVGRDGGVNPYRTPKNEMLSSIQSVPTGTTNSSIDPDMVSQNVNNSQGMSFEEFMTPPDINIMDSQYDPQFGSGGGSFTDVTANQFTGTGQNPALSSADSVSSAQSPLGNIGASEVLGAGMQVGSNLMAMNQYGDAISNVEEGLGEIPGMLSETLTSAQTETDNVRELLNTNVQSSADTSNQKLQDSLAKLSSANNSVGNIQNVSNNIRRTLQQGIDNTIAEASDRFDIQSTRIQESKRASVDAIESMKAELESKKKELEKEKKQAGIGAAVGVASLGADLFLGPGTGQLMRTGWNTYASNT
tara:strand:+ start:737 stop:2521 length:1785 start_codon:yes stop_codon:yes gene_type:complete